MFMAYHESILFDDSRLPDELVVIVRNAFFVYINTSPDLAVSMCFSWF